MSEQAPKTVPDIGPSPNAERLVRCFEKLGLEDLFGTPEDRRLQLDQTEFPAFEHMFFWANGVARDRTRLERSIDLLYPQRTYICDYSMEESAPLHKMTSEDILYVAPEPEEGRKLQEEALTTAKTLDEMADAATVLCLVSYLTQRASNGNTRTAAVVYSLLTRGYANTPEDKEYYQKLLQGHEGLRAVGLDIDTRFLRQRFAAWRSAEIAEQIGYAEPLPTAVTPFKIGNLFNVRRDLPHYSLNIVSLDFAERDMNIPVLLEFMVESGFNPEDHIITQGRERVIDMKKIFAEMAYIDVECAIEVHDRTKAAFVRSIIDCYRGNEELYGSYKELTARFAPSGRLTGK